MTISVPQLSENVYHVALDGKDIYLVGTAHVSKESVEDVRNTVEIVKPNSICVELCAARHKTLMQRDAWQQMNIFKVLKEKKALFLLAQLIMTSFYRRLGEQLGVQPGAEMIEGVNLAEKTGSELVLADRDIQITLKRVWGYLNVWNKLKMISQLLVSLFFTEKIDRDMIEEMKKKDQLEDILKVLADAFPEVKKRLIDERDLYLSQKIRNAPGRSIVAVVGAAHIQGILNHIQKDAPLDYLLEVPPKSFTPVLLKWAIPLLIISLLITGFVKGGAEHSVESIYIWILVNGIFSAIGAALAFAHPLTILSAFVGAPLTSLNPMIAAGWVAGIVQAWVKKPTVTDLEDLPNAIMRVKGFWMNPVTRILLVVLLANLGSSVGTFVAGGWIAMRTF
jgi:pheromone shutdown-related protein TraB